MENNERIGGAVTAERPVASGSAGGGRRALTADLSLLLVTAIWGTTFVVVKDTLQVLPPFTLIALRFTFAVVALALLFGRRLRGISWTDVRSGMLVGVFLFVGFATQTLGLQLSPASTSAFITGLSVVLVPLVALVWLKHRPATGAIVGVAAAAIGLGLLTIKDSLSFAPGDTLTFGCAVAFAFHIVAVGKFAPKMDALVLTLVQLAFTGLLSWGVALTVEHPTIVWTPGLLLVLLYMGVVATGLVFCIQNVAQRFTPATHTALIFTMEPVFAAFFAFIWLGEQMGGRAGFGAVLILAGMLAAEFWPRRCKGTAAID